jgi:cell division transport system ATP-binding protein
MSGAQAMIVFEHVSHCYGEGPEVLADVSFTLACGEMAFLTGASGAGKSTLLNLVALLTRPARGRIYVDGIDLTRLRRRRIPAYRRGIGMIFQNPSLLAERTVFDNVALPLLIRGLSGADIGRRVRAALDAVGLLHKEKAYPPTLSGGEQQRVGIARAVVAKPPLLLADEPTGNLDPDMAREVMRLFLRFNQVGVSVLVATHALGLIHDLPCRLLQLSCGTLIEQAPAAAPEPALDAG